MKPRVVKIAALLAVVLAVVGRSAQPEALPDRAALRKQFDAGNFRDAYEGLGRLALDPRDDPQLVGADLGLAIDALIQLGGTYEVDELTEDAISVHAKNWRLLWAAAADYQRFDHRGYLIAGKFSRGLQPQEGQAVSALERDRVRALQLMTAAMPLAAADTNRGDVANFYLELANMLLAGRGYEQAWRLQSLSDLRQLPDYEPGWYTPEPPAGAAVDVDGQPVFFTVPKRWQDAANDGQRWRWALARAAAAAPDRLNEVRWQLGQFCESQFGVQTMADYGPFFAAQSPEEAVALKEPAKAADANPKPAASGAFALQTLADDETIARLATGIRRFKLPDEFNFIKIYQQIADEPKTGHGADALDQLARIFENRRQYDLAADYWRRGIKEYGPGESKARQASLQQIVGNWGVFEPRLSQPAGKGATVDFRYRNAHSVHFEAQQIKVQTLLADIKAYLKTNPRQLDPNRLDLSNIGFQLVDQNQKQYLGATVAAWDLELKPIAGHFDRRLTIATPLQQAGAYLLTAKLADGNTSRIIVWLEDTAIVRKPLADGMFYYVADAASGQPIARANLEFFGYRQKQIGDGPQTAIDTLNFAEQTDADGQLIRAPKPDEPQYSWLITATAPESRFAYLGFTNVWYPQYADPAYDEVKVFTITDRPVYRPGQKVKFKFWVRHARYDQPDTSDFANQSFTVEVRDPKGSKIVSKAMTADAYGGLDGDFELPGDSTLGVWQLQIAGKGGGSFRVEEYKKPEFEVSVDAPSEPIRLGERIKATVKAKYYFGSPVTDARVKYKVLRTSYAERWLPPDPWDWLYGRGYWWFAYDCPWYPGWSHWGTARPPGWWWPLAQEQPEVVAERTAAIGPDGTLTVEIDTAVAAMIHPDQDHQYRIVAEVTDPSRRTIVGEGSVLVARQPFQVSAWVDRGYYHVGDVIRAEFHAQTLAGRPVRGDGQLTLFKVTYKDGKPVETQVRTWALATDEQGSANLQIKASEPGQYRLAYRLTDEKKQTEEAGYLLTVVGDGFDGSDFRFNDIELIPDQRQYAPKQAVNLMVNTNRSGAAVLLFVRPSGSVYLKPVLRRLKGRSLIETIPVEVKDMPNFFVEAVTIGDGRLFTELKEIVVPPEQRVLNVAVQPSRTTYKPTQKATVAIKLTDMLGKPFVGSTVVSIYDKAVEYISGGSNVPEIKAFFWQWRRNHQIVNETNLQRYFEPLLRESEVGWEPIGLFGGLESDWLEGGPVKGLGVQTIEMVKSNDGLPLNASGAPPITGAKPPPAPLMVASADPGRPVGGALVQPTIRSNFADTALWVGALSTNEQGEAEVALTMPENLTTWKVRVWALGHGTKVGQGDAEVITRKDLIVRLQAPRFFVEKDEVVLSANVHNDLKTKKQVQVSLDLGEGHRLSALGELVQTVEVPAGSQKRVDWRVKVTRDGEAIVRMKALTDEESDAVEQKFPVYVHGMLKMDSFSGALRPADTVGKITLNVPAQRRQGQSELEVRYSPSLAAAMVDALPYLAAYPYGCTEQTLNRFLPTVVTQKVLIRMGLDLKKIGEQRTNLNAQELGGARQRAAGWKRFETNPVFNNDEVTRMVKEGVRKLTDMQNSDGGWGWFSGWGEQSFPHTTAVVVHGLQVAQANDVALVPGVLEKGVEWLKRYQDQQVQWLENALVKPKPKEPYKTTADNLDAFVYMVLTDAGVKNPKMQDFLYRDRVQLAVYAKALFGLALEKQGEKEKLAMILDNIRQYVVEDNEDQTAYLKLPENNFWWAWYGSDIEADAYYLKLLARSDPKGALAPKLVKYLLNNRKNATYWNSTRDTSLAIEALAEYLKASGEDKPDMTVEVWLDGKQQKEVKITAAELFTFDNKFVLHGDGVTTGKHVLELRKQGQGPLYYNAYLTYFTLEDYIPRAGLEVKVNRKIYKLVRDDRTIQVSGSRGQAVAQRTEHYQREELKDLAMLKSGDLVEVELEIDSKNDYEYLIFEDKKAAGFEAVDLQSGYNGNSLGAYMELRDDRVSFFVRALARGKHSVSYRLRAEIPGRFSALPARAAAMYAPELKANSDEIKLQIED